MHRNSSWKISENVFSIPKKRWKNSTIFITLKWYKFLINRILSLKINWYFIRIFRPISTSDFNKWLRESVQRVVTNVQAFDNQANLKNPPTLLSPNIYKYYKYKYYHLDFLGSIFAIFRFIFIYYSHIGFYL